MYKPVCCVLSLRTGKILFELLYAITKCVVCLQKIIHSSKKSCAWKQAVVVYARECMAAVFEACSVACHVS